MPPERLGAGAHVCNSAILRRKVRRIDVLALVDWKSSEACDFLFLGTVIPAHSAARALLKALLCPPPRRVLLDLPRRRHRPRTRGHRRPRERLRGSARHGALGRAVLGAPVFT